MSNLLTNLAGLACGGATATTDCSNRDNYTATNVLWIDIWKRNADIIYNLPSRSIELVEKVYPIYETEHQDPELYLSFFDRLFPQFPQKPLNNSFDRTLDILLFQYCQLACALSPPGFLNEGYIETLMLPWILQQVGLQLMSVQQLPLENVITASYCKKLYKISLAPTSFYMFTIICLVTNIWCLLLLIPTILRPTPIISWLGDANIYAKLSTHMRNIGDSSIKMEEQLRDMNIKIERRMRWDDGTIQMNNLDENQVVT